jgi:hypothetical protein
VARSVPSALINGIAHGSIHPSSLSYPALHRPSFPPAPASLLCPSETGSRVGGHARDSWRALCSDQWHRAGLRSPLFSLLPRLTFPPSPITLQRPAREWVDLLVARGVPSALINGIAQASVHPQIAARRMLVDHVCLGTDPENVTAHDAAPAAPPPPPHTRTRTHTYTYAHVDRPHGCRLPRLRSHHLGSALGHRAIPSIPSAPHRTPLWVPHTLALRSPIQPNTRAQQMRHASCCAPSLHPFTPTPTPTPFPLQVAPLADAYPGSALATSAGHTGAADAPRKLLRPSSPPLNPHIHPHSLPSPGRPSGRCLPWVRAYHFGRTHGRNRCASQAVTDRRQSDQDAGHPPGYVDADAVAQAR